MKRRLFVWSLVAACSAIAMGAPAFAQSSSYPDRPVSLIVPFSPGGSGDTVARIVTEKVGSVMGQPLVVENVPGASGAIGVRQAIRADPDGYTLLQISGGNAMLPLMQKDVYDLERDMRPILMTGSAPYVFAVKAGSKIQTFDDLVALAKEKDGVSYASAGLGTLGHLCPERLAYELNFSTINVPFPGLSGAIQALIADEVDFVCTTALVAEPFARNGDIRLLGAATESRLAELPDTPTMAELGFKDFEVSTWHAYLAPAATPDPVVGRLIGVFTEALDDAAVRERLRNVGIVVQVRSGQELAEFIKQDMEVWKLVIEKNNITIGN